MTLNEGKDHGYILHSLNSFILTKLGLVVAQRQIYGAPSETRFHL